MKKIGLIIKEESESIVKDRLGSSQAGMIIQYSGLTAADLSALRQSLHAAHAGLLVVKNSVAVRALKNAGKEALLSYVQGPCGIVFSADEPVGAAKVLYDFAKTHEHLKVSGGFLQEKILAVQDIEHLSKLPSRETLRAQVVMVINAPRVKLVRALNSTLSKLVICVEQIRKKKS